METKQVLGNAARGAGHIISGEARERLGPVKEQIRESTAAVQSKAGRQIIELAGKIRKIGARLDRESEAQAVARKLEETADYIRFRPPEGIARDAVAAIQRNRVVPVLIGIAGAVIAYKMIASRGEKD